MATGDVCEPGGPPPDGTRITFTCPQPGCHHRLFARREWAGQTGRCTRCKTLLRIPTAPEPVPARPTGRIRVSHSVERVTIDGERFRLVQDVGALVAAVDAEGRGVLRLRSLDYGPRTAELDRRLADRYGASSPQRRDVVAAELWCAGCGWQFPGSYVLSVQAPDVFGRGQVLGATPGAAEFGRTGVCPQCASGESLLVYEHFPPDRVTEADVHAVAALWRERGREWWRPAGRSEAVCDSCNGTLARGEGSLQGRDLVCDACIRDRFLAEGLLTLRENPHYYGAALLRKARRYRTET